RPFAGKVAFPGDKAFYLSHSLGFPLEVTMELCKEHGFQLDLDGFELALRQARELSRGGDGMANVYAEDEDLILAVSAAANTQTDFVGYESSEARASVVQISPRFDSGGLADGNFQVCLNRTPF